MAVAALKYRYPSVSMILSPLPKEAGFSFGRLVSGELHSTLRLRQILSGAEYLVPTSAV
jgi:hypothetical protein